MIDFIIMTETTVLSTELPIPIMIAYVELYVETTKNKESFFIALSPIEFVSDESNYDINQELFVGRAIEACVNKYNVKFCQPMYVEQNITPITDRCDECYFFSEPLLDGHKHVHPESPIWFDSESTRNEYDYEPYFSSMTLERCRHVLV